MLQTLRVLLVEDDDSLRNCLGELLGSRGFDVGATGHAVEALRMVQRQRYDFSLLDFHLPGMTGLELFQQVAALRPLPSILMSGLASAEEAAAAAHAGFFAFLRKPLDLARLRTTLDALVETHFRGKHRSGRPGKRPSSLPPPPPGF